MNSLFLILSAVVLIVIGESQVRAADYYQPQSNVEDMGEEIDLQNLPLTVISKFVFLQPLAAPQVPTAPDPTIRINLFPVLNYKTKEFGYAMKSPGDPYLETPNLGAVRLTSLGEAFHVTDLQTGAAIADGKQITFNLQNKTFTLDKKVTGFHNLLISQQPDAMIHVDWKTINGTKGFDYYGSFIVTREMTPRKNPAIRVINVVDLEKQYVPCVTPNEMAPDGRPLAALEAQATAARTYGYISRADRRAQNLSFDVFASTQDQLYVCKAKAENDKISQAVANTAGKVIYYNNQVIRAMYSSNCAGQSVGYQDYSTQHTRVPYLTSVKELDPNILRQIPGGTNLHAFNTQVLASRIRALGITFPDSDVLAVTPFTLNSSGRATSIQLRGTTSTIVVSGSQFETFKNSLGLRSYIGSATATKGSISIPCYGNGHNVGFCQEGGILAAQLAEKAGRDSPDLYSKILSHYYKGATVGDYVER